MSNIIMVVIIYHRKFISTESRHFLQYKGQWQILFQSCSFYFPSIILTNSETKYKILTKIYLYIFKFMINYLFNWVLFPTQYRSEGLFANCSKKLWTNKSSFKQTSYKSHAKFFGRVQWASEFTTDRLVYNRDLIMIVDNQLSCPISMPLLLYMPW